ncbi:MAG: hypothetical protein ACSHWN_11405 [Methylophilaceae bacterium]
MLPPWLSPIKDELHILIRPQSFVLKRFKGFRGFKLTQVDQHAMSLSNDIAKDYIDIEGNHLAAHLERVLNNKRWQASSAKLILSSYFVRYMVIPWNAEITTDEEFQAYLNHQFISVFGETIRHWNKSYNKAEYGCNTLASAVHNLFLQTAHHIFKAAHIKLESVHPQLMSIANQARKVVNEKRLLQSFWITSIADGRVCLSLLMDGEWCFVKNLQAETDVVMQIEKMIQREELLNVTLAQAARKSRKLPMILYWVDSSDDEDITINGCRIIKLKTPKVFGRQDIDIHSVRLSVT